MPIYTDGGVLLADGTSLKGCCCDEFVCGDSLEASLEGLIDDSCTSCDTMFATPKTMITRSASVPSFACGYALSTELCGGQTLSYGSTCFGGLAVGTTISHFTARTGGTYHAFGLLNIGDGVFGGDIIRVWHKSRGTAFSYPIVFTSGDLIACHDTAFDGICDFSSATLTFSLV